MLPRGSDTWADPGDVLPCPECRGTEGVRLTWRQERAFGALVGIDRDAAWAASWETVLQSERRLRDRLGYLDWGTLAALWPLVVRWRPRHRRLDEAKPRVTCDVPGGGLYGPRPSTRPQEDV